MINPSTSGWIDKFFSDQKSITNAVIESTDVFYSNTRKTGFIYGYIVSLDTKLSVDINGWTEDEISKIKEAQIKLEFPIALKPYFDYLEEQISYDKIRIGLAIIEKEYEQNQL